MEEEEPLGGPVRAGERDEPPLDGLVGVGAEGGNLLPNRGGGGGGDVQGEAAA